jgi:hypothetical protein
MFQAHGLDSKREFVNGPAKRNCAEARKGLEESAISWPLYASNCTPEKWYFVVSKRSGLDVRS